MMPDSYDDDKQTPPPDVDVGEAHDAARKHILCWVQNNIDFLRIAMNEYRDVLKDHLGEHHSESVPDVLTSVLEDLRDYQKGKR